jgi:hypothetical protein
LSPSYGVDTRVTALDEIIGKKEGTVADHYEGRR